MNVVAFALLAAMLVTYALLDGYDLGVGAVVRLFARSDDERGAAIASIGPFWIGNEVWLIAAGGVLFAFFPRAYASSFSGFYLLLMVMLWLLMFAASHSNCAVTTRAGCGTTFGIGHSHSRERWCTSNARARRS
jgi:cytochrome d ubiquinol oxidase subunit II